MIGRIAAALRSGDWLHRGRVLAYARIFFAFELATALFLAAGTYGLIVPLKSGPVSTDFVSFYAAGTLANEGRPAEAYDRKAHEAAENRVKGVSGISYNYFFYPPIFLLVCAVLARLPYLVAFTLFEGAGLAAYLAAIRGILGLDKRGRRVPLLPFAAFPAVLWNIGMGQNGLFSGALVAGGTSLIDRSPLLAGALFGGLAYKPHFGLLIPVALFAGRRWRAVLGAGATVAVLMAASYAEYGLPTWLAFLETLGGAHHIFEDGRVGFSGLISPFAAVLVVGGSPALAYAVQILATAALMGFVGLVWGRNFSLPVRGAALAAALPASVPVILFYDFAIAAVAIAWLARAGESTGFRAWEKSVFIALGLVAMVARSFALGLHLPLGPIAEAALVAAVAARAWSEWRHGIQDGGARRKSSPL